MSVRTAEEFADIEERVKRASVVFLEYQDAWLAEDPVEPLRFWMIETSAEAAVRRLRNMMLIGGLR